MNERHFHNKSQLAECRVLECAKGRTREMKASFGEGKFKTGGGKKRKV